MIADPDGTIARLYKARRPLVALDRRISYVIDPEGRIAAAFHHELSAGRHEADVRQFFTDRFGPAPVAADTPDPGPSA